MIMKNILRIAWVTLAIPFCHAQEEQKITLQFLAFPKQESSEPIELLVGEGKTIPVDTPGNELSQEYRVTRPASIVVGITTKNAEGEPVFKALGQAPCLSAKRQIVLLMRKGQEISDGFEVLPIDGELGKFSGGDYLFINTSELAVGGIIGDKKLALKPGQRSMVKPVATHKGGGCQITLSYQRDESDTKGKKFFDTRWSVNERYRTLVFFYQDRESKKLGVAPIIEML
jgi:hypothetical protein